MLCPEPQGRANGCSNWDDGCWGLGGGARGNSGVRWEHSWRVCKSKLFLFFKINLFINLLTFWLRWVFVAVCGLSLVAVSGGYSWLLCVRFLSRWLLLLRSTGPRLTGFSSCSTRAQ